MKKILYSIMWSAAERLVPLFIQFGLLILLARNLEPEVFGLMGIVMIILALSQVIIDTGFASALIREGAPTELQYSTTFVFNVVLSLLVYLFIFFVAPILSEVYEQQELTLLTRLVGLNVIFSAIAIVPRAKLTIELSFRSQMISSLVATTISGTVALILARNGFGVWALVSQSISQSLIGTIFLVYISKWKINFKFDFSIFKAFFDYGYKLLLTGILDSVFRNLYVPILSKNFGLEQAGLFSQAQKLSELPCVNLGVLIQRVFFPILSKKNIKNEPILSLYIYPILAVALLTFPIVTLIAIYSEFFILSLLGESWIGASNIFSILCFAFMLYPIQLLNMNLYQLKGETWVLLKVEVIRKVFCLTVFFITTFYGIEPVCYGIVIGAVFSVVLGFYKSRFLLVFNSLSLLTIIMFSWLYCLLIYLSLRYEVFFNVSKVEFSIYATLIYIVFSLSVSYLYLIKNKNDLENL